MSLMRSWSRYHLGLHLSETWWVGHLVLQDDSYKWTQIVASWYGFRWKASVPLHMGLSVGLLECHGVAAASLRASEPRGRPRWKQQYLFWRSLGCYPHEPGFLFVVVALDSLPQYCVVHTGQPWFKVVREHRKGMNTRRWKSLGHLGDWLLHHPSWVSKLS